MDTQVIHKPSLSLVPVTPVIQKEVSSIPLATKKYKQNPFIEANTKSVSLSHLQKDCIIPVFSKDNERTIAHTEFIDVVQNAISTSFHIIV
jgi:hypothetical protein